MPSEILKIKESYGPLTEILPDELIEQDVGSILDSSKKSMEKILQEDLDYVKDLIGSNLTEFPYDKFSDPAHIIRWAFNDDDSLKRKSEFIKRGFAQWSVCRIVLPILLDSIILELPQVRQLFRDYNEKHDRDKRISFIYFTRQYQKFVGYAVNILDVIDDYISTFDYVCNYLDKSHQITVYRMISAIHLFELEEGVMESLLRGNFGRFTAFPLLRSFVEIMVTRSLLDTRYSSKYRNKFIIPTRGFQTNDMANLMEKMGVGNFADRDSLVKLYNLGSLSVHRGVRTAHSRIWYSLFFGKSYIANMLAKMSKSSEVIDKCLDEYLTNKKIEILDD